MDPSAYNPLAVVIIFLLSSSSNHVDDVFQHPTRSRLDSLRLILPDISWTIRKRNLRATPKVQVSYQMSISGRDVVSSVRALENPK